MHPVITRLISDTVFVSELIIRLRIMDRNRATTLIHVTHAMIAIQRKKKKTSSVSLSDTIAAVNETDNLVVLGDLTEEWIRREHHGKTSQDLIVIIQWNIITRDS